MTDLQRFAREQAEELAALVARWVAEGTQDAETLEGNLRHLVFRDDGGAWWALAPSSGSWYRATPEWVAAGDAPASVEGLLAPGMLAVRPAPPPEPEAPADALAGLQGVRLRVGQDYRDGLLSSAQAEALLAGHHLLDRAGRCWLPGFASGDWYCFHDGAWHRSAEAPDPARLVRDPRHLVQCSGCGAELTGGPFCSHCGLRQDLAPEDREAVVAGLVDFLRSGFATLPEPVAPPWTPPEGFPEAVVSCPACGLADLGPPPECRFCGTPRGARCAACQASLPAGSRFCNMCGAPC